MTTATHPAFELSHFRTDIARFMGRWLGTHVAPTRQPAASTVTLARAQILAVTSFQGGSIECTEGSVWLTHDGDCRDVLLEAGQCHVADRNCRLIIYAVSSSAVRLGPRAAVFR